MLDVVNKREMICPMEVGGADVKYISQISM